jgi:hypothetical protein
MTAGCLTVLILLVVVLATGLSWLWYSNWHVGKVVSERRHRAVSSILQQARNVADDTARSLDASRTGDLDELTGVIWKHTGSPLITYDASRRAFTARLSKQVMYETSGDLLGGGSDAVSRCLDFTYSHPHGHAPTGTLRTFTVRGVTRGDGRVTVAVLLSSHDGTVRQCYRITRPATVSGTAGQPPVTSTPSHSC